MSSLCRYMTALRHTKIDNCKDKNIISLIFLWNFKFLANFLCSLSLFQYLFLSIPLSLSFYLSLCLSISLYLFFLFLSLSNYSSFYLSFSIPFSLSIPLSLSFYSSFSNSLSIYLSFYTSSYFNSCFYLFLSLFFSSLSLSIETREFHKRLQFSAPCVTTRFLSFLFWQFLNELLKECLLLAEAISSENPENVLKNIYLLNT